MLTHGPRFLSCRAPTHLASRNPNGAFTGGRNYQPPAPQPPRSRQRPAAPAAAASVEVAAIRTAGQLAANLYAGPSSGGGGGASPSARPTSAPAAAAAAVRLRTNPNRLDDVYSGRGPGLERLLKERVPGQRKGVARKRQRAARFIDDSDQEGQEAGLGHRRHRQGTGCGDLAGPCPFPTDQLPPPPAAVFALLDSPARLSPAAGRQSSPGRSRGSIMSGSTWIPWSGAGIHGPRLPLPCTAGPRRVRWRVISRTSPLLLPPTRRRKKRTGLWMTGTRRSCWRTPMPGSGTWARRFRSRGGGRR